MNSQIRVEFVVNFLINPAKLNNDPLAKELRDLGKQLPYRVYLEPSGELLSDRMFDISDPYSVHEVHFLDIEAGRWTIRTEELSGWLSLDVSDLKVNTLHVSGNEFVV